MKGNNMYFIKINDVILPTPSLYSVDNDDIDSIDSRRSDETGLMHRRRIRKGVRTCNVKWILSGDETAGLHVDLSEPLLSVSLLDPAAAGYSECEMYAKNMQSVFYQQQNGTETESYWEITCTLVEY